MAVGTRGIGMEPSQWRSLPLANGSAGKNGGRIRLVEIFENSKRLKQLDITVDQGWTTICGLIALKKTALS